MEMENELRNTRGIAGAGLGLGIAGTALGVLNGGGLGNILGGYNARGECAEDHFVNRYELNMQKELTNKDMEIAYLKGRDAAKSDSLELYRYIDGKFAVVERELADQRTYNAVNTTMLNCVKGDVAALMALTKTVIPNSNVCPGWGDVTVSVTPAPTTAG
jgi:hypothetical protein